MKKKGTKLGKDNDRVEPSDVTNDYKVTIQEYEQTTGETLLYEKYEKIIPVSALDHAPENKIACEACHKFGRNFACPPHSPDFLDYIDRQQYAKIICIRMPQEYFSSVIQEEIYSQCFENARSILVEELLRYRKQGFLVAGSGFCLACEACAIEEGAEKCKKPNKRIYSLESLGVNLSTITQKCFGFNLE